MRGDARAEARRVAQGQLANAAAELAQVVSLLNDAAAEVEGAKKAQAQIAETGNVSSIEAAQGILDIEEEEAVQCRAAVEEAKLKLKAAQEEETQASALGAGYADIWLQLVENTGMMGAHPAKQMALETEIVVQLSTAMGVRPARIRVMSWHPHKLMLQIRVESASRANDLDLGDLAKQLKEQAGEEASALRQSAIFNIVNQTPPALVFGGYQGIEQDMPRLGHSPRAQAEEGPRPASTHLELRAVLRDPPLCQQFLAFLSRHENAAPLLYFQRVDEYREAPSEAAREAMYDVIWWLHLAPHSFFRVYVHSEAQASITASTDAQIFPESLLDNSQAQVRRILEHKLLVEFAASGEVAL